MTNVLHYLHYWMRQGLGTPLMLVIMLSMMMLPLPPFLIGYIFYF